LRAVAGSSITLGGAADSRVSTVGFVTTFAEKHLSAGAADVVATDAVLVVTDGSASVPKTVAEIIVPSGLTPSQRALAEICVLQGLIAAAASVRGNPVDDVVFTRQDTKIDSVSALT